MERSTELGRRFDKDQLFTEVFNFKVKLHLLLHNKRYSLLLKLETSQLVKHTNHMFKLENYKEII